MKSTQMEFHTEGGREEWQQFIRSLNTVGAAERIRRMREKAGISQKKLAEIAGCSINVISQMEKGQILNKEMLYIYSICQYFHCSLDWLMCESNYPSFEPNTENFANYLRLSQDTAYQLLTILRNTGETGNIERRGLNHLITADPASFVDLCRRLDEFSSAQCITKDDEEVNSFAEYQLGRAWRRIQKIFLAAFAKEKQLRETEKQALDEVFD